MNLSSAQSGSGPQVVCGASSQRASMQLYLSTFWYLFLAATTAVGLLVSLVSNMIIIYLFTSTPALRQNPSNIIAANLSLSDLLYCCQWPSVIYCSLTQSTWILEIYPVCQAFGFITVSTGLASVQTVLVMSIERVFVIRSKNPLKAYSSRLAWLINLLIWLVCILSSLPPLFGRFNRYTLDPSKTSCTLDYLSSETNYKLYIVVLCVVYWILPFLVISVSYALIFLTFKKSSLTLETVGEASFGAGSQQHHHTRRLRRGTPASQSARSQLSCQSFQGLGCHARPQYLEAGPKPEARRTSLHETESKAVGSLRAPVCGQVSPASKCHNNCFFAANAANLKLRLGTNISIEQACEALRCLMAQPSCCFSGGGAPPAGSNVRAGPQTSRAGQQAERVHDLVEMQARSPPTTSWKMITKLGPGKIRARLSATTRHSSYSRLSRTRLQFRLARMSLYLIILWLISWTPLALLSFLNSLLHCHRASATLIFIAATMTKLGPTFDVFIYGISHPKIKSRFKQIIGRMFRVITFRC